MAQNQEYFLTKTNCEFAIISQEIVADEISRELNINPDRTFKKGEIVVSKHSKTISKKPHNLWAIRSKSIISAEQSITLHINYLKSILENKMEILSKYKRNPEIELIFSIWIETEDAGFGFSLSEQETRFIYQISNRCDYFFLTRDTININEL